MASAGMGSSPVAQHSDAESEDDDGNIDFTRRVVTNQGGSGGLLVSRKLVGCPSFRSTMNDSLSVLAQLSNVSSASRGSPCVQPTEMACLDYVPSVAIRPIDMKESLRPRKSQRKIRLLIGKSWDAGLYYDNEIRVCVLDSSDPRTRWHRRTPAGPLRRHYMLQRGWG